VINAMKEMYGWECFEIIFRETGITLGDKE
jgi:hypothetical protein